MNSNWRRNLPALVFVTIFLVADLGMGVTIEPLPDDPETAVDTAERTWEGGGSRLLFVDTMSSGLATYLEQMDPLPGSDPFDYYGGAVPQVDSDEIFGLWQADRWRHEWWRWGEESLQVTETVGAGAPISVWQQTDLEGQDFFHFGNLSSYPGGAFSAVVSPVVDLRNVEPVGRGAGADAGYRLSQPRHGLPGLGAVGAGDSDVSAARAGAYQLVDQAGAAHLSNDRAGAALPPPHNASAALRLRHAYGFQTEPDALRDGGRVEVSLFSPVHGWLDWQPLAPSTTVLRVGDKALEGRYATPLGGTEAGLSHALDTDVDPEEGVPDPGQPSAYAGVEGVFSLAPAAPWMYQGRIAASTRDDRSTTPWVGFGGQSGGFVESVFDLTPLAGHLARIRFVAASLGSQENNPGLGWALDQMEVHAAGQPRVELLASVTPTEGALLKPDADPPLVVALQNTHPESVEVNLRAGIKGDGGMVESASIPPGPWGRTFHTFGKTLRDLSPEAVGLQRLTLAVTETPDAGDMDVVLPVPSAEGEFHFQLGGPQQWRAVRVVTEVAPMGEDDVETRPDSRVVKRGQEMLVHVDLENLGPEEIQLDFSQDAPLEPKLLDALSASRGTFIPPGVVTLPPSRDASGSLGDSDAVRRVTWRWSGINQAVLLDLFVDRVHDDGNRTRVLDGGVVRVETMQPYALSVDLENHWKYTTDSKGDGCRREAGEDGRDGVLKCINNDIHSPVAPVQSKDLRRGNAAYLFLVYRGEGDISFEVSDLSPEGEPPGPGATWNVMNIAEVKSEKDWKIESLYLGDFDEGWLGWIRIVVDSDSELTLDEIRIEVGPSGKRLPLLWHTFSAELAIETSGSLRSASGGALAVLDGAAARASDAPLQPEIDGMDYDDNQFKFTAKANTAEAILTFDMKIPAVSILRLPGSYTLNGARPALHFQHWMAPSPSAVGHVEAARVDPDLPEQAALEAANLTWGPVATFIAPLETGSVAFEPVAVPLWDHAGETVLLRFRYEYALALQPNALPQGWVLDSIAVDQVRPGQVDRLHESGGHYVEEGYESFGVRFRDEIAGVQRARPLDAQGKFQFGITSLTHGGVIRDASHPDIAPMCSTIDRPNTYSTGQSVITDALDLRALEKPVLVLEHGGRFGTSNARLVGAPVFDLEYQILQKDGLWGPWQRATPHDSHWNALDTELTDSTGSFVHKPFTSQTWDGNLKDNNATVFSLAKGAAGEVARFRFHVWEVFPGSGVGGGPCDRGFPTFRWALYGMQIYEDIHLFDAEPTEIDVSRNDRPLLDRAGASSGLEDDAAVVAGDTVTVDVHVRNNGTLSHLANVTLILLRADGTPVPGAVRFLDRSGEGPGRLTERSHGTVPLQPEEEQEVGFRVEFNKVEPGTYKLRAVVDLDDALDTNPRNDILSRQVHVAPIRALEVDASAKVEPIAGIPDDARLLTMEVHNRGNVRDSTEVHAKVVELVDIGREVDIGPPETDGQPRPYLLKSQMVDDLAARTGRASLQWDLVNDVAAGNNLVLGDLLRLGSRYAVNITLVPSASLDAWWMDGEIPDHVDVADLTGPASRCGCYHIPFLVEDLIAESDLTDSNAVLDGYMDSGLDAWGARTSVRVDGVWESAEGRADLPMWGVVDRDAAGNLTGALGQGDAWHLPPYDGFEVVEHTLISPPLPGHVISSTSQGILDLRYAREGGRGDVRVEVRTLEPGGTWGDWGPVDGLRASRVAVVLPPDYPQTISNRVSSHPIPPFYTKEVIEDDNNKKEHPFVGDQSKNIGVIQDVCNNLLTSPPECRWSPFPNFPLPGDAGHNRSIEVLAQVLRTLADAMGPNNIDIYTTFPKSKDGDCFREELKPIKYRSCFGEFALPREDIDAHGILFSTDEPPRLHVKSEARPLLPPHELSVLELEELGSSLGTYGALLVMGDGLARYVAGRSEGEPHYLKELEDLATVHPDATLTNQDLLDAELIHPDNLTIQGITHPAGEHTTTEELDRHFPELLRILRLAPSAGVMAIGGLGPASASIGLSGVAEDVPLALWIPDRTPVTPGSNNIPLPVQLICLVENNKGDAFNNVRDDGYIINITNQPKSPNCGNPNNPTWYMNYLYSPGFDTQAWILRNIMSQSEAIFSNNMRICNKGQPNTFICANSLTEPISHQHNGLRFITAADEGQAKAWVEQVLKDLAVDGSLPHGQAEWQNLPLEMGTPVGGVFQPGPDGAPRFVGETMQFRVVVRSDPNERGHGWFLLDHFRFLGTPPAVPDVQVRVVDPSHGSLRQPGELGFYVTLELINRGLDPTEASQVAVRMLQRPGDGDCQGGCILPEFHPDPNADGPMERSLQIPPLSPGGRYVVTLGVDPLEADPGAPAGIVYAATCTPSCPVGAEPFKGGVFPNIPQGAPEDSVIGFDVTAEVTSGPPSDHDDFAGLNDIDTVSVVGTDLTWPLVKDPTRDVRVLPNQAVHSVASGTSMDDFISATDAVDVRVRLTNNGSRPAQVGHVTVDVYRALPNDCWDPPSGAYYGCMPDRSRAYPQTPGMSLWQRSIKGLEIPRGSTVQHVIPIDLEEAGLPPDVYRVEVRVETVGHPNPVDSFERWVYLADSVDGQWAFLREDLSGIHTSAEVAGNQSGIWSTSPQSNGEGGSPFFMNSSTLCSRDTATRAGTTASGTPLEHGWRLSDAMDDACTSFHDGGSHALHWLRNATRAWNPAQSSWQVQGGESSNPSNAAATRGVADFGPDALVWHPGHDKAIVNNRAVNGVQDSLAKFAPGAATLVLDTRFQATPNTAYVVEMQVPVRRCDPPGIAGTNCRWVWDWGAEDSSHWFPLQAIGGVTTEKPHLDTDDRVAVSTGACVIPSTGGVNPPTVCSRNEPTNPLGGLPGIWGTNSTDFPAVDGSGWLLARYPIDPKIQNHAVRGNANNVLYQGLEDYCNALANPNHGDVRGESVGINKCLYSWSQGSVQEKIPRPVAFRLRAASYAGDEGANRWQVRDLTLTSHNLRLDGAQQFEVPFTDGETRAVPVDVHNAGPVDDVVEVRAAPLFPLGGLEVGVASHSLSDPDNGETMVMHIPAGQTRTAWVHVHFAFGSGGLTPEVEHEIPIEVVSSSTIAPSIAVGARVDAILTPLHRADLVVGAMVVDGNDAGDVEAAEGVPVHATLMVRNQGSRPVDGEPVLVRLLAREVDPDDRTHVLDVESVAQTVVTESFGSHCFRDRCSVPVNLEWTPDRKGVFELVAEVNLPRLGDAVARVPEIDDGNNVEGRIANVGAVPLADLRLLDVRVVPFDGGCAPVEQNVTRIIAGHSYCLAARVTNAGSRAAVDPVAEFSIGASAPFSRGQGDGLPNPLEASHTAWVFSSPVRAALPRVGDLMEFQVQLDTRSTTASVEAKDRTLLVPVDDYDLELLVGDIPDLLLQKGGESTLSLRVRNTGTAVATPQVHALDTHGLRVRLVQPPPLQPGEEAEVVLVLRAGLSSNEGTHDVEVLFSVLQDPLVRVPLPLRPTVDEDAPASVSVLPLRTTPGQATLDMVVDNTAWTRNGTWTPVEATGAVRLPEGEPRHFVALGHDVVLHGIPVVVPSLTLPGEHDGTLLFLVTHGSVTTMVEAPYVLHVEPEPGLAAGLADRDVVTLQGVDARLSLHLENTGNVPVEASLRHAVDSGFLAAAWQNLTLAPGDNRSVPIVVEAGAASRSLGESLVRWREVGGDWNDGETVLWSVRHVPGSVRISSTDLADVTIRPDEVQTVRAFLQNPGREPVEAEAVLVVDGVLQSRQRVLLPADAVQPVDLPLRVATGDHVIQVVARPAGADVGLSDPVFHDVGDVRVREVDVGDRGGGPLSDLAIPGPGVLVGLLGLLGAALVWRRR